MSAELDTSSIAGSINEEEDNLSIASTQEPDTQQQAQAIRTTILPPDDGGSIDEVNTAFRRLLDASGTGTSYEGSPEDEAALLRNIAAAGEGGLSMQKLTDIAISLAQQLKVPILPGWELEALPYVIKAVRKLGLYLFHNLFTEEQAKNRAHHPGVTSKIISWFYEANRVHTERLTRARFRPASVMILSADANETPDNRVVEKEDGQLPFEGLAEFERSPSPKDSKGSKGNIMEYARLGRAGLEREFYGKMVQTMEDG